MHVLFTCKIKNDWINKNRQKVETLIIRRSRAAISVIILQILIKFEVIPAFRLVLSTCKYHEDYKQPKLSSGTQRQLTPQSVVGPHRISNSFDRLYMPLSCNYVKGRMRNRREKVKISFSLILYAFGKYLLPWKTDSKSICIKPLCSLSVPQ